MKILGIIPARGGSKGIPKKNSKLLGKKPLIAYTIEAAQNAKLLSEIILSSDDDEIIQVAKNMGLKVPFKRPKELASDESPTIVTVIHAIEFFKTKGIEFDAICLLQVTNPFRTGDFIDEAIKKFMNANIDSLISVLPVPHEFNPHWVFESDREGKLHISTGEEQIIPRRQELPDAYHRDGAIYITKTEVILKKHSLYGDSIGFIESDASRYVNIDTFDDWKQAENMLIKLGI